MEIRIKAPSRLHFSLIDLSGSINRVDGGIGVGLTEPYLELRFYDNQSIPLHLREFLEFNKGGSKDKRRIQYYDTAIGRFVLIISDPRVEHLEKVHRIELDEIFEVFGTKIDAIIGYFNKKFNIDINGFKNKAPFIFEIKTTLFSHTGLGSKTQLLLSFATALKQYYNKDVDVYELTKLVGRGGTSGIGYRVFEKGGFILDCGHRFGKGMEKESFLPSSASNADPARTVLRYDFPEDWYILLVILNVEAGASKSKEVNIFQQYCPIPIEEVREISHIILMQLLPAIIEKDLYLLGKALKRIRQIGFKKYEIMIQHSRVKELIQFLENNGGPCVGMSSFGPTVYTIFDNKTDAEKMLEKIDKNFKDIGFLHYITTANNKGAEIIVEK